MATQLTMLAITSVQHRDTDTYRAVTGFNAVGNKLVTHATNAVVWEFLVDARNSFIDVALATARSFKP